MTSLHFGDRESFEKRRAELGRSVASRRRIFLDTKFWVYLRDAATNTDAGRRISGSARRLYEALRERVERGTIVCPLEQYAFAELLKQKDPAKRRTMARVVDQLSGGVCLLPQEQRLFVELVRSLWAALHGAPFAVAPLERMWTRIPYVLGVSNPENSHFGAEVNAVLREAFHAHMWGMGFEDMLDRKRHV